MLLLKNPTRKKIQEIIHLSKENAAKWIKDSEDQSKYYWPSEKGSHEEIAKTLHIQKYEKGIEV
jgi:hypothetical protein